MITVESALYESGHIGLMPGEAFPVDTTGAVPYAGVSGSL